MKHDRPDVILVGAGGPLGAAVAGRLSEAGQEVVRTRRAGSGGLDASDHSAVRDFLREHPPRAAVYLVNPVGDHRPADGDPLMDLAHFIEAAGRAGIERFVFTSSAAVYGDAWNRAVRESDELAGTSDYARHKIEAEDVVRVQAVRAGISAVSLRIFNVFGPGFHDSLINRAIEGPPPGIKLTSTFVRDYVHGADVARAVELALKRSDVLDAVNIGSGVALDNMMLATSLPPDSFVAVAGDDSPSYSVASTVRADETLGFQAAIDVMDVIRKRRIGTHFLR